MSDVSHNLLKRAIQCREIGDYSKAQDYLNEMIEDDPENYLLWYEKSKLPIVQEDTVTIKNRTISFSTYQKLPLADKNTYLQGCGFGITELPEIEGCLKVPAIVESQRIQYLKMAIAYAPEDIKSIYLFELKAITDTFLERGIKEKEAAISIGVIALFVSMAAVFVLNSSNAASITKIFINQVIFLSISYILSITGMVLYTKAKSNGKHTVAGLVCNLIALVISNLSIINAILVHFFK